MPTPNNGSNQLRVGRVSIPWTTYLLTFCTHERATGLDRPVIFEALLEEIKRMEADSIWQPQALMLMPDHVHLCIKLLDTLALSHAMARLKSRTRRVLLSQTLQWQEGYHDHRLRPDDPRLPFCYYLYINPVRAGLVTNGAEWTFQWWRPEVWTWFEPYAKDTQPAPAWAKDLP